ncbi:MAG: bifunctional 5,10-methylenetetrahydrofolate dehydrogenase/5,10-methenyltetrahydrofolate cyclohydrolase [Candidatus Helarchaeota archaeon]
MGNIINGKKVAEKIKEKLVKEIKILKESHKISPGLATILIGEDPGSKVYIKLKHKACEEIGIYSELIKLSETVSEDIVLSEIDKLNNNEKIHGILVQLPLPKHLDQQKIMEKINPEKDVDGFHPINIGKLANGDESGFIPCTPKGMLHLLEQIASPLEGKNVTIINHSTVIGRPLAMLLLNRNATVSICHVKTDDLKKYTEKADIIVTAAGVPNLIKPDMVKKGVIIIDAGFSRVEGKIHGDADFNNLKDICSYITPPTGGVGPMTIVMLLKNTVKAARKINHLYLQ